VVIDDLDVERVSIRPAKANPPLVVDADAVLAFAASSERFQAVSWGHSQVFEPHSLSKEQQFSTCLPLDREKPQNALIVEEHFRL
jgi:hypothetical protein